MSRYTVEVDKKAYEVVVTPLEKSREEKEISEKGSSSDECKSLDTLLEVSMDEHTKAKEQTNGLDNKASIFITAIIAFLAFYLPLIPADRIINVYNSNEIATIVIITVALTIMLCAALIIGVSFYMLYRAIKIRSYLTVNRESLIDKEIQTEENADLKRGLILHYNNILKSYDEANYQKAKALRIGLILAIISFVLLITTIIIIMFCTGGQTHV